VGRPASQGEEKEALQEKAGFELRRHGQSDWAVRAANRLRGNLRIEFGELSENDFPDKKNE